MSSIQLHGTLLDYLGWQKGNFSKNIYSQRNEITVALRSCVIVWGHAHTSGLGSRPLTSLGLSGKSTSDLNAPQNKHFKKNNPLSSSVPTLSNCFIHPKIHLKEQITSSQDLINIQAIWDFIMKTAIVTLYPVSHLSE